MNNYWFCGWKPLAIPRPFLKEEQMMTEQIEAEIGRRARNANTRDELVDAIFASFVEHEIDPAHVSLEDMKVAVVLAFRSARQRGIVSNFECLA